MYRLFLCFLIALGASAVPLRSGVSRHHHHHHHHGQNGTTWNIIKLTQSWLPSASVSIDQGKMSDISNNSTIWTIHGLWPTKTGTEGPNYCNDSWKFDLSKIQVLRPKLDKNWPPFKGQKPQDLWKHEWEKHGTCGTSLPALKNEFDYFNKSLDLHDTYNLSQILAKAGVVPSPDRRYSVMDVLKVLKDFLSAYPYISCEKKSGEYYLEQIEICLTKSFETTDCPSSNQSLQDLLFQSERVHTVGWGNDVKLNNGYIHDCGSGEVYYKPNFST